jgi:hypothetical protein
VNEARRETVEELAAVSVRCRWIRHWSMAGSTRRGQPAHRPGLAARPRCEMSNVVALMPIDSHDDLKSDQAQLPSCICCTLLIATAHRCTRQKDGDGDIAIATNAACDSAVAIPCNLALQKPLLCVRLLAPSAEHCLQPRKWRRSRGSSRSAIAQAQTNKDTGSVVASR